MLLGSDSAELSSETQVEIDGSSRPTGLFTAALTKFLSEVDSQIVTYGEVIDSTIAYMHDRNFKQTPLLVGDRGRPVFVPEDIFLGIFEFAKRRNYSALGPDIVKQRYHRFCSQLQAPFPEFHCSAGRALTEFGYYDAAVDALETALHQSSGDYLEASIALARAQLGSYRYSDASSTLRQCFAVRPAAQTAEVESGLAAVEMLLVGKRRNALLVGISNYRSTDLRPVKGAVNDVLLMKKVLQENWYFQPENVTVLLDEEATSSEILHQFEALCDRAGDETALFYFAGNGSITVENAPTLISVDGRQEGIYDIPISKLADMASGKKNIVSILDAGWTRGKLCGDGMRTTDPDTRERQLTRDLSVRRDLSRIRLQIGGLTIYQACAIKTAFNTVGINLEVEALPASDFPPLLSGEAAVHGRLSHALARALASKWKGTPTYREFFEVAKNYMDSSEPFIVFTDSHGIDQAVLDNAVLRARAIHAVDDLGRQIIDETILKLQRVIEQRNRQGDLYPQGWLILGIAYYAKRDYDKAAVNLKHAAALYEDESVFSKEAPRDPQAEEYRCEVHYQLGRTFYESKHNLTRAVDELNKAFACDSESPHVLYHLGQAIREMVERETLTKAETVLKKYLEKGAPLGHEDEVREFLGSRKGENGDFRETMRYGISGRGTLREIGVYDKGKCGEVRPAPPMDAFTDIDGKEGALKILFLGDGRGDLPGVRSEFQAVLGALSALARQGYLRANFLLGPNLTKHNLESRVTKTQYNIVYYAGHTRQSGRLLPFAESNLDTLEFLRIINQNPPGLLIMNACTSLGNPEKLDLMNALFIKSGVVFAIGTSSVVRDDMPVKSFPQLFESLICGRTFGEALSDAIRKDPHGLEQYFLLGDPSMRLR